MKILSPKHLHYPITVLELERKRDDEVARSQPLFRYLYETVYKRNGERYEEEEEVTLRVPAHFSCHTEGVITKWYIKAGTVIQRPDVPLLEIEEPCTHEIQFGGLCAQCGKDMTEVDYLTEQVNTERAKVNMTHNNTSLLISDKEAGRAGEESKTRLLEAKKLSLIVDLDQTVIHTTCEKTVAEWQADPENPNYDAVKDVESFQLADDNVSQVAANWYYVKMRPGLKDFLERMSKIYEMHIYTMATRAYAQAVAKIIDPDGRYFGDRILSRDENYTDKLKSIERLFPTNKDMVVIIDDRADVWDYSRNLVRVPVFNFFPGAGDINASFLPKQQELIAATAKGTKTDSVAVQPQPAPGQELVESAQAVSVAGKPIESESVAAVNGDLPPLEQQILSMASKDPAVLEEQVKEQERVIIEQQTERPLLQKQLMLDKEDEKAEEEAEANGHSDETNGIEETPVHHRHRHSILHDDDRGLEIIERHLKDVHQAFYDSYRPKKNQLADVRVAALRDTPKKRIEEFIPDIGDLMPEMKEQVLMGVVIVFSGIIPLGMDVQRSDLALWVKSFGAQVAADLTKHTTHVIANPDRKTTKVKKASRYPQIQIVNVEWLLQCCTRWEHVDEGPYLIEMTEAERGNSPFEELEDTDFAATGDEAEDKEEELELDMSEDKWKSYEDELDEFMNESDETDNDTGSDSESIRSDASAQTDSKQTKRKRKRDPGATDESGAEDSDGSAVGTSKLQQRKKRTIARVTSLTNVLMAADKMGLPSPETTGPEEGQGDDENNVVKPTGMDIAGEDEDYDDLLEAEMLAEFEKSGDDEDI